MMCKDTIVPQTLSMIGSDQLFAAVALDKSDQLHLMHVATFPAQKTWQDLHIVTDPHAIQYMTQIELQQAMSPTCAMLS